VIEDAAQALGARFGERRVGTLGTFGCYSFFPTKNLGALGDAGLVTTNDARLAETLRMLRMHGSKVKYRHEIVGGNFRIDALQAAFLRVKLPHLEEAHASRARNARRYTDRLLASGLAAFPVENCLCGQPPLSREAPLLLPFSCQPHHIYNQYILRVTGPGRREALRAFLTEKGVGTEIYYPLPLHQQACFASLPSSQQSFPWAETFAAETLAVPIFPELRAEEIDYVCDQILEFLQR
jgi:dTDP-4-amino-4,6-dideoxygalactose transaminase